MFTTCSVVVLCCTTSVRHAFAILYYRPSLLSFTWSYIGCQTIELNKYCSALHYKIIQQATTNSAFKAWLERRQYPVHSVEVVVSVHAFCTLHNFIYLTSTSHRSVSSSKYHWNQQCLFSLPDPMVLALVYRHKTMDTKMDWFFFLLTFPGTRYPVQK